MNVPAPGPGRALDDLAAAALAEALQGARQDAVRVLRSRLTERLVAAAEEQWAATGRDHPSESQPASVPEPAVEPVGAVTTPAGDPTGGWYVYGVARARSVRDMDAPRGISGRVVEAVPVGDLAMVGSWLEDSSGWEVDGRSGPSLDALAPRVDEHQAVLEYVMTRGPVAPFRFGRLYPDPDPLRQLLAADADSIGNLLDRLEGRSEWGLTLHWSPSGDPVPTGAGRPTGPGDGSAYLARRGRELATAGESARRARLGARSVHDRIAVVATDCVVRPAGRPRAGDRPVALRAAYLVADADADAFRRAAATALCAVPPELGLAGDLTGPWPPYSFSSLEPVGSAS